MTDGDVLDAEEQRQYDELRGRHLRLYEDLNRRQRKETEKLATDLYEKEKELQQAQRRRRATRRPGE